jgi:hypothetical protein
MSQAKVEVEFDEQELSRLEAARGGTDLPTFIREITMLYLEDMGEEFANERYTAGGELLLDDDEDLTPEDHVRLAAETKANSLSLKEVRKALDEQLAELKAERQAGILR